ncbi:hypothetical protein ACFVGX_22340 [Streptomyces sp. NPDC127113]|uniref:hypothetical protein n=1 Tax=Streptomyces sp. NPDC127113 TaxID=3345365 RepID=UPI003627DA4F
MPLSVPLLLVPGEPDRHYTVHTQRARWDDAKLAEHGNRGVSALMEAAREGLRFVSECVAAELADADVVVIEHPDGAEAVARVLCDSDVCAAVAEQYHRDADEDVEAEAARAWAATQLQDQSVELLKLRAELEKFAPGKTVSSAKDMLAAVLAVQQERTGGSTDRVVLMVDEAAFLARESGLLTGGTPEEAREEIARLIRQGRKPYPTETAGEAFESEAGPGRTRFQTHRLTDFDTAPDSVTWVGPARGTVPMLPANEVMDYLGRQDAAELTPEHLVRETVELARAVAVGGAPNASVMRLGQLTREVASRCNAEANPACPADCEPDEDPGLAMMLRVGYRPRAVRVGEVRAARRGAGRDWSWRTLPDILPDDDDATLVLVYREPTPGLALLEHIRTGIEQAVQNDITLLLRWLTADGK